MNSITITFGLGNQVQKAYTVPVTVATVLADVKGVLGFGDNVEALLGGVPVSPSTILRGGETIKVQNKACAKAA